MSFVVCVPSNLIFTQSLECRFSGLTHSIICPPLVEITMVKAIVLIDPAEFKKCRQAGWWEGGREAGREGGREAGMEEGR